MNRKNLPLLILLVLAYADGHARTQAEGIREGALKCAAALQRGDYETFAKLSYPKLVDLFGGREQMIAVTKAAISETEGNGVKLISSETGQPGKVVSSNQKLFSVVPTLLTMSAPGARITQKSFLLAISTDNGNTWTFVDGAGLNPDLKAKILPDLPSTLALPRKEAPVIERAK